MKKIYKFAITLGIAFGLFSTFSFATINLKDTATMQGIRVSVDANEVNLVVGENSKMLFEDYTFNTELKIKPDGEQTLTFYAKADEPKELLCSIDTEGDLPIHVACGNKEVGQGTTIGSVGTDAKAYTLRFSLDESAELGETCDVSLRLGVQ